MLAMTLALVMLGTFVIVLLVRTVLIVVLLARVVAMVGRVRFLRAVRITLVLVARGPVRTRRFRVMVLAHDAWFAFFKATVMLNF